MDIREELKEDFERCNKRLVMYDQALKTMQGEDKPPCFSPVVDPDQLQRVVWAMTELLSAMRATLKED